MSKQGKTAGAEALRARADEVIATDARRYMNTFGARSGIVLERGEGVYVYDCQGRRYLDMLGGIAVSVLGHGNAALREAVADQAGKLIHCSNYYYTRQQAELADRLCALTGLERCFFVNSGAEANETALKLARAYFYKQGRPRPGIVCAEGAFHGRTLATVTATGQAKYSAPFAPLPEGFTHVPYNDLDALRAALTPQVGALMLELVQGESGVHPADHDYIHEAARLCRANGSLLLIDEIQTGMGRCGRFTAAQLYGLQPDIMTLAKGLAGGVPIGACLAGESVAAAFAPGDHGTTFGGNPLACRAALSVLDEIERLGLVKRAAAMGAYFARAVKAMAARLERAPEIRGFGLMLALERPDWDAAALKAALQERGALVGAVPPHTLRLLPPLIIGEEEIDAFVAILEECLQ